MSTMRDVAEAAGVSAKTVSRVVHNDRHVSPEVRRRVERVATAHLTRHGHRRIGFVGDTLAAATTSGRLDGYHAALADAGIRPDRNLVIVGTTKSRDSGAEQPSCSGC